MSQRLKRVSELMKRELSELLNRDFEFQGTLVSIHDIDLTPDLKNAHVYISTLGAKGKEEEIVSRLQNQRSMLQAKLSKRVILKYTPHLHFHYDDSIKRGTDIVSLMDSIDIPEELKPIGENDVEI
ncbi:MAG: 30S ribosome-binding factor RbfA [Verrucomicrobiota bacterium]